MKFAWKASAAALLFAGLLAGPATIQAAETGAEPMATATTEQDEEAAKQTQATIELALDVFKTGGADNVPEEDRLEKALEILHSIEGKRGTTARSGLKRLEELKSKKGPTAKVLGMMVEKMITSDAKPLTPEQRKEKLQQSLDAQLAMEVDEKSARKAISFAGALQRNDMTQEEKIAMIDLLIVHFNASDESIGKRTAARLKGMVNRMTLVGNPIVLEGTKLGGEDLNFPAAYEGKVVLVDFWATWCGPCVREFPNMERMYNAYHSHGFEIVGISLDKETETVEEFIKKREIPWTIIHNQGGTDPNVLRYGVTAIPTMILVGKDGKVVSTSARGAELVQFLAEAFPDVEVPAEEAEPEAADQGASAEADSST